MSTPAFSPLRLLGLVLLAALLGVAGGCVEKKKAPLDYTPALMPARLIVVPTLGQAETLEKQIASGQKTFAQAARDGSSDPSAQNHGNLGLISPAQMQPELGQVLAKLAPGQMSPIVETEEGFALLLHVDNTAFNEGLRAFTAKEYEAAVKALEADKAQNPDRWDDYHYLGLAYEALGRLDEAAASLSRLAELNPKYASVHNNLGNVLHKQGRTKEAINAFSTALLGNPSDPVLMNNLAWALAREVYSLDLALKLARAATKADPGEPEYLDTLAEVHLARGEPEAAAKAMAQAVRVSDEADYYLKRQAALEARLAQGSAKPPAQAFDPLKAREVTVREIKPLPPPKTVPPAPTPPGEEAEVRAAYAAPVQAAPPAPRPQAGKWLLQLASFRREEMAARMARQYQDKGWPAFTARVNLAAKGVYWRVHTGPYPSQELAEQAQGRLKKEFGQDSIILRRE